MKKSNLNKVFTSLLVCMLAVTAFALKGCKDESDSIFDYPKDAIIAKGNEAKPIEVKLWKGTLSFDDKSDRYVIISDGTAFSYEHCNTIYITNMTDEYKSLEGRVVFSGTMKKLYNLERPPLYFSEGYYTIELSELISEETESRSLSNDSLTFNCFTPAPEPPTWFFTRSFTELDYNTTYNFKVFVHVVRPSSGTVNGYVKENVASATIDNLNDNFSEANITFSLLGSAYIDNSTFINLTKSQVESSYNSGTGIFAVNQHSNAIDIYVLSSAPNLESVGALGYSGDIPSKSCLLVKQAYMDATVIHEIGHCLGLYHTHHGTAPVNTYYHEGGTPELVNGSNSTTAGDFISDTPADPCMWNGLCTYIGTITDANGAKYNPDPENIMSYSRCQSIFTQKQLERIYETIDHSTLLQALCTKTVTNRITTPSVIGSGTSYTMSVDAPDNYIVTWNVSCKSCTSKTSSNTYTETLIGRSVNLVNRYPNASSQRYDIEITIRTHLHDYEFKAYKTLFKVSNPATTGTLTWSTETNSGTINLSNPQSSSPIIIRKGQTLSFIYTDACGASSYTNNDVFSYSVYSPSGFSPVTGANHIFRCESYASVTTNGRMMLSFVYPGSSTVMQIPIQILAGAKTLNTDSLELEKIKIPNDNKVIVKQ